MVVMNLNECDRRWTPLDLIRVADLAGFAAGAVTAAPPGPTCVLGAGYGLRKAWPGVRRTRTECMGSETVCDRTLEPNATPRPHPGTEILGCAELADTLIVAGPGVFTGIHSVRSSLNCYRRLGTRHNRVVGEKEQKDVSDATVSVFLAHHSRASLPSSLNRYESIHMTSGEASTMTNGHTAHRHLLLPAALVVAFRVPAFHSTMRTTPTMTLVPTTM